MRDNKYIKNCKKNSEGYDDPTAYQAIKNVEKKHKNDDADFYKLLDTIFNICDLAGYHVEGRIVLKNKKTGDIRR